MKKSRRPNDVLSQIPTHGNTASTSNYASVGQISSLSAKIGILEASLDMSLRNQKTLNDNLQYMLEIEKKLRKELEEKDMRIKQLEKYLTQTQLEGQKRSQDMLICKQTLEDSYATINALKEELEQKESLIARKQTTIREQKKVIQTLESEKLYNNLNEFDSIVKEQNDNLLYQLKESHQKKLNQLEYQLKRSQNNCYSEKSRSDKLQKQLVEFKRWLCRLVGYDKIVTGCEKTIMKEVEKRMAH